VNCTSVVCLHISSFKLSWLATESLLTLILHVLQRFLTAMYGSVGSSIGNGYIMEAHALACYLRHAVFQHATKRIYQ
jgi:hypothetical protein